MERIAQSFIALLMMIGLANSVEPVSAQESANPWFERRTTWNDYDQFHFKINGRAAYIVAPKETAPGKPWVWRARFPGYHAEMDVALLGKGFHIAYVDVAGLFGSPKAVAIGDHLYEYLTTKHGFAEKPALEGVSRGGLFVYNWAVKNPHKVACIYCDTPVLDFRSWPGGIGTGLGSKGAWQQCLAAYGLTEAEALKYEANPIDRANTIAEAKIPLLHIVSENDRVVPPSENTYLLKERLKTQGHDLAVISVAKGTAKSNGHHFDHPQPKRVVDFILQHAQPKTADHFDLLRKAKRIVFLGDSITYAGQYVADFEAWLLTKKLTNHPTIINMGLPSETVSGLSEDGHAGGRFPRPDLAERLDRVLTTAKPDLVFACYGINCGIYQPFDEKRFQKYQEGIRNLKKKVEATGATLVVITPPFYDDLRGKKAFSYDSVMDRYSKWLVAQREEGWLVIDLHRGMLASVARKREVIPGFTYQPDAVHPNDEGHWLMARFLIHWVGDKQVALEQSRATWMRHYGLSPKALKLVRQQVNVLRDAYLSAAGHKRPGIRKGVPIPEAEKQVEMITKQLQEE